MCALHLLVDRYNVAMGPQLFNLLTASAITQVICATALIQPDCNSIPILLSTFYFALLISMFFTTLAVFGFAGDFYASSFTTLSKFKRNAAHQLKNISKREHSFRSRFLVSCQVQKVKFGLSNFIDKTTPVIFEMFCVNRIVDMLLLK